MSPHIPVMVHEVLFYFQPTSIRTFFDGTVGCGGHAKALLEEHKEMELYIGVDRDRNALQMATETLLPWKNHTLLIQDSFSKISPILSSNHIPSVDGILLDIGISSLQIDTGERGFSFQKEGPLDMRMDTSSPLTAEEIINTYSEKALEEIFHTYGEERASHKIAKAIVIERKRKKFKTTRDLASLIENIIRKRGKRHPATQIFQALRIAVNNELCELEQALENSLPLLNSKKRLAVISFHSLEDRIVKNMFRKWKRENLINILTPKPIFPTRNEIRNNFRARSAKLRVMEKI